MACNSRCTRCGRHLGYASVNRWQHPPHFDICEVCYVAVGGPPPAVPNSPGVTAEYVRQMGEALNRQRCDAIRRPVRGGSTWPSADVWDLLTMLQEEVEELRKEVRYSDTTAAIEEAVDVANYAMMIADNLQREQDESGQGTEEG
jgi:NTP pyrophosphatase (non-canonical NTP hydrolase)